MMEIFFRHAVVDDAREIVSLAMNGFPPPQRSLLLYACTGAEDFVRRQIAMPKALAERRYLVAKDEGGHVKAIVDLVRGANAIHLAYIAVEPSTRGMRVASRLLLYALQQWQVPAETINLDVFTDNKVASQWYHRLGFEIMSEQRWVALELGSQSLTHVAAGYVCGLPSADVVHQKFGFSEFSVQTSRAKYSIGRLGDAFFRATVETAMKDRELLGALQVLDSRRSLLVLTAIDLEGEVPGLIEIARSTRRYASVESLMRRLKEAS